MVDVVLPTIGKSPVLYRSLKSIISQEIVNKVIVVLQTSTINSFNLVSEKIKIIKYPVYLGFSLAANIGYRETSSDFVAFVNDDVILDDGYFEQLYYYANNNIFALQGKIHCEESSTQEMGFIWNKYFQAVPCYSEQQLSKPFGTSATATLYLRRHIEKIIGDREYPFDLQLNSFYEDVYLSCRLRALGLYPLVVDSAKALHKGSSSFGLEKWYFIYRNRHLVLLKILGRSWITIAPLVFLKDLIDFYRYPQRRRMIQRALSAVMQVFSLIESRELFTPYQLISISTGCS